MNGFKPPQVTVTFGLIGDDSLDPETARQRGQRLFLKWYDIFSHERAGTDGQRLAMRLMMEDPEVLANLDEIEQTVPGGQHWIHSTIKVAVNRARVKMKEEAEAAYQANPDYGSF